MIDFIGRLMKNPVKNGVKETDPVSLLRDVTADGDAASVCSPIMTVTQSVKNISYMDTLNETPQKKLTFPPYKVHAEPKMKGSYL